LLGQLHTWLSEMLATLSRKSDTSRAILYALNRWEALTCYCDDGRLEIDNLPVVCWVVFAYRYRARRPADEDA
jgi:transposase